MLSTTLRCQCTSNALPSALRAARTTRGLGLLRTFRTEHGGQLQTSSPRPSTHSSLASRSRPKAVDLNAVFATSSHLTFRQAFHATARRQKDFSFDITDGPVAAILTAPFLLLFSLSRRGRKLFLVLAVLFVGLAVYADHWMDQRPLKDLRVWRIEKLITQAEIERREREREVAAAAGVQGMYPEWAGKRTAHSKVTGGAVESCSERILARLEADATVAPEEDRAQMMEDLERKADELLEKDREIARAVMSRADVLDRGDYRPFITYLVAVDMGEVDTSELAMAAAS